jgi:uncharacterized protein (TIGR03435 family)
MGLTLVPRKVSVGYFWAGARRMKHKLACAVAEVIMIGVSPLGLAAAPQTAPARTPAGQPPGFDAASVKLVTVPEGVALTEGGGIMVGKGADPRRLADSGGPGTDDPNRIHYPLISLKQLLRRAWNSYSEIESPGWLDTQVVAVDATMPPGTTPEQFQEMLRNLIISRFEFKYHAGTKKVTGYALVVNKSGPKLKESGDQTESPMGRGPRATRRGADGFPMYPPQPGHWAVALRTNAGSRIIAQQYTMQELAGNFARLLKAPVTDGTQLTAKYDFTLTYSGRFEPGKALNSPQPATPDTPEPQPDLFSALQSELGLKLEPKKVDVPVMVVDHMARTPSRN